uniref:ATP synthase mitochondrial F1 complex assembly factor 1 n=1 Tax=Trieres chinensis TaxID=1514140 RepID=A0A7S2EBW8_TRICV|mmetsp:Transcript_16841/g.34552  ORF Transcript_16841/g.34552 Transcript_16841/m.34552 type:complete len:233 (+) Transcript_16841:135-833(+)
MSRLAFTARSFLINANRRPRAATHGLFPADALLCRSFSFSFAGPRKLDEIMKTELLEGKSASEVTDIWMTYHEGKDRTHGLVIDGEDTKKILSRATKCPFFVQPIFREEDKKDGYFMLLSQYQGPSHFLMAYLEDYKMDPARAQPLLTFSVFDDLSETLGVGLVRCDVINKGIEDDEGRKVMNNALDSYRKDEEFFRVRAFNEAPESFDVDDYISCQSRKWRQGGDVEVGSS